MLKTAHPTQHVKVLVRVEDTTGATRGEPIARRARTRKAVLERAQDLPPSTELRARGHRAGAGGGFAGDVEHLSYVTAAELDRWLEHTKHLAEVAPKAGRTRG